MSGHFRKGSSRGKKRSTKTRRQRRRLDEEARLQKVGTSTSYLEYLSSKWWKYRRRQALKRAKHRCEKCGATKKLEVHHKTYETLGKEKDEDLQVLCVPCHEHAHQMILEMDQHLWDIAREMLS